MRTRRAHYFWVTALLAATAGLAPIPSIAGRQAQALPLTPQPIFSEELGDGRVLARFTHGVTVVAVHRDGNPVRDDPVVGRGRWDLGGAPPAGLHRRAGRGGGGTVPGRPPLP